MEFLIGCNYWASNAGTEMWNNWSPEAIEDDLKILSSHGVKYMRVFPIWSDFQPVKPLITSFGRLMEYRLEGDKSPENPYYLDEVMLERFSVFCDLCEKYDIKLVVGLITGYMSGRLFVPSALYDRNIYSDPVAILFQQRFITGFVKRFKDRKAIYAWDLGNECNNMSRAEDRYVAANWTSIIANTIRANDNTRQVVSGMHELAFDSAKWTIADQGEFTDILTTHPYPYWLPYANKDEVSTFRTTMHATAQSKLYKDISRKPCIAEEIGTMGPMVCSNELAADFLRVNLFSNFSNGISGVMWWCANEQSNLTTAPYTWNMVEVELGMIDAERKPKPVLMEMKKFHEFLTSSKLTLNPPKDDAVCILSKQQEQVGISYMACCMAKQSDVNLRFSYGDFEIPESDYYLLPSISGGMVMSGENWAKLKDRVFNGANLYISVDNGILSDFNTLTGLKVIDASYETMSGNFILDGLEIPYDKKRNYRVEEAGATIIAKDEDGNPIITEYSYGKGRVYFVNFPLETALLDKANAFDQNIHLIYKRFFKGLINTKKITSDNQFVAVTEHHSEEKSYCVAINYSKAPQKPEFKFNGCKPASVIYGNIEEIPPFDAVIFEIN